MIKEWLGDGAGRLEMLRACLAAMLVNVRRGQLDLAAAPSHAPSQQWIYQAFIVELEKQLHTFPSVRDVPACCG